jgi:hypothetical protein
MLLLMTSLVAIGISDPGTINETNPSIFDGLMANYSFNNESPIEIFANESDNSSHNTNVTIVALESMYDFPYELTDNCTSDLRSCDEDVTSNEKLIDQTSIQVNGDTAQIGNQYAQALGMGSATNNVKISTNDE